MTSKKIYRSKPTNESFSTSAESDTHWLVRPSTIRLLWIVFIVVLMATLGAQIFVHLHAAFGIEGTFGFHAWYGFSACVAMIIFAKGLGYLIKRSDKYYEE